jgi:DNA-binding NarL/FixJ family response regulator
MREHSRRWQPGNPASAAVGPRGSLKENRDVATRLVLVDDHAMFREGLRTLLSAARGIQIVGEAANGHEAIRLARELDPDILVMDLTMPGLNGIEAMATIVKRSPTIKVIALSAHSDRRFVAEAIKAGASGYVVKTAAGTELVRAIHAVSQGNSYLSPEVAADVMRASVETSQRSRIGLPELTPREREILKLLAEGLRSADIATRLYVAPTTVDVHRRNLMRKLNLHTVAELTKYALREGITEL